MTKVIITFNDDTQRFEARDINDRLYYTASRKDNIKTAIKGSKKYNLEIVEVFETKEDSETSDNAVNSDPHAQSVSPTGTIIDETKPEAVKPVEEKPTTTKGKPAKTTYETYKQYIITNFTDDDLHLKSDKIVGFCNQFNLVINKTGRNLTFWKTLSKMVDDGIIEYLPDNREGERKYKKLVFQYTDAHRAAMLPDEEEL